MKNILNILFFSLVTFNLNAETYYCWAISGLNVRLEASPTAKIIGKIEYAQKVDINEKDDYDFGSHTELFLKGIERQPCQEDGLKNNDIYFEGSWYKINQENKTGYIFSGYLSRFSPFKKNNIDGNWKYESSNNYIKRNYTLLNRSMIEWDSSYHDDVERIFFWKEEIMVVNDCSEKGYGKKYYFPKMTLNEALLFIKFDFGIHDVKNNFDRRKLNESGEFYGIRVEYDKIEIFWPAPDGHITIQVIGNGVLIDFWGSC